jgi:plastocyanin
VVNSGFSFGNPSAQPSFAVKITAPVGGYSFLCLLHPGMEVKLNVVADATTVPTPQEVSATASQEETQAATVDGPTADHQAQTVQIIHKRARTIFKVSAGGFSKGVSANEYPNNPIVAHVGDRIKLTGTGEIHTGTFPKKAVKTTPFIQAMCEVTGPDTPATSPASCSDPSKFELVLNPKAFLPTKSNFLQNPTAFVNSGLVVGSSKFIFEARKPGVYHFVCLVHGPSMSGEIKILA